MVKQARQNDENLKLSKQQTKHGGGVRTKTKEC